MLHRVWGGAKDHPGYIPTDDSEGEEDEVESPTHFEDGGVPVPPTPSSGMSAAQLRILGDAGPSTSQIIDFASASQSPAEQGSYRDAAPFTTSSASVALSLSPRKKSSGRRRFASARRPHVRSSSGRRPSSRRGPVHV